MVFEIVWEIGKLYILGLFFILFKVGLERVFGIFFIEVLVGNDDWDFLFCWWDWVLGV